MNQLKKIIKHCEICNGDYPELKHNFDECYSLDGVWELEHMDNKTKAMGGKQNRNGKALEYILAKKIADHMQLKVNYHNYRQKYDSLSVVMKRDFVKFANTVFNYIKTRYPYKFDRLVLEIDAEGKNGNSSDITVGYDKQFLRLSIKNNKKYAKSQRPSALPRQCGYRSTTIIANEYMTEYNEICSEFYEKHKDHSYFRDIGGGVKKLYTDINTTVFRFLRDAETKHMKELFKFLLDDNIQIVNKKDVYINDFTNRKIPDVYNISINRLGYIIIKTDTGMVVSMRLHTASSRLTKNISLKYDTVVVEYGDCVVSTVLLKDDH
jgi:hypothetical protein